MKDFTFEEQQLMSIYNPGTRLGLIHALVEMRTYLDKGEQELKDLTDSAIAKFNTITDAEFTDTNGEHLISDSRISKLYL